MPALANASYVHDPRASWLYMIGRVKPGVALEPLQQKVSALVRQYFSTIKDYVEEPGKSLLPKVHVVLTPGGAGIQHMQEEYASKLHLLMWVAGIVLLIACANIANLLLVRGMARRTELSVRTALGAMRGRIIRQLLTESVVLAVLGGVAGLVVGYAGAQMLLTLVFPGEQNVPIHASPSLAVIGFACGLSLLTGVLFGVAPAWIATNTQPVDALRGGARMTATGASRLQRSPCGAASGSFPGAAGGRRIVFAEPEQAAKHRPETGREEPLHRAHQPAGEPDIRRRSWKALYRTIEQQFHALPGIKHVGIATYTPMEDNNWSTGVQVLGQPSTEKGASWVRGNADYFDSVGTHVLMGRGIQSQDTPTSRAVAVVNQAFVKEFFKDGANPLGQHFGSPGPESAGDFEIVGVVEDTAYTSVYWKNHSMFFMPAMQRPASDKDPIENDLSLYAGAIVLETERPMNDLEMLSRTTLSTINPNLTVVKFQTFAEQIADRFHGERLIARLTTLFGALALLLAMIGLYGVTAYTVARRTPEIGIRMAVGAERASVVAMVMRGAVIQIAIGLAIGLPAAVLGVRFVKTQLYEITSVNPLLVLGAIAILITAACVAGIVPAKHAASIEPAQALRSE